MKNINHYPNIIFNIDRALLHLSKYDIQSIMDLAVISVLKDEIDIDNHVVLISSMNVALAMLSGHHQILLILKINHFDLNKLAYIHGHSIPYSKFKYPGKEEEMRFVDSWLVTTKFKLPKWLYNKMQNRALNKHRNLSYVYDKDSSKVKTMLSFQVLIMVIEAILSIYLIIL